MFLNRFLILMITDQPVNMGDMMGMKVPCKIRLTGGQEFLRILDTQLAKLDQ